MADNAGVGAAVVPEDTLWRKKKVLKVYFMGEQTKFMYKRAQLKSWMVMNIVKEGWKFDGVDNGEHVPRFEQAYHATDAEIRVKFETDVAVQGGSWSKLGSLADSVPPEQHTMILNLKDCVDDDRKEATILHEFGHALGLGHEHQHPKYVTVMEKFIDIDATMDCYGIEKPSFYREQYGKLNVKLVKTEYDPDSIMHYPTKIEMLKEKYQHLNSPDAVDKSDLKPEEKEMLKHFLRHIDHVKSRPSVNDLKTVTDAYYQEHVRNMPAQQPVPTQQPTPTQKPMQPAPTQQPTQGQPDIEESVNEIKYLDGGRVKTFNLGEKVSGKWRDMGIRMGIGLNTLDNIEDDKGKVSKCWQEIMKKWMSGEGARSGYPATWEGLYELLNSVKVSKVAQDLKKAVNNYIA